MSRLQTVSCVAILGIGVAAPTCLAQTSNATATSQAPAVRTPSQAEVRLLQAFRANPATAPYPFSTEPRGSKILVRGRVGAKIVHDVAVRMSIELGIPIEDAITIDTAFNPTGGRGGFGTVPGPGPTTSAGIGFGGPPAFGNNGIGYGAGAYGAGFGAGGVAGSGYNGAGAGGPGYGLNPYAGTGGGGFGSSIPPVLGFPSAGSYGGAPSLLPPPIFGRYDDPFYGFDPPAVVYPPWWGALNAQRVQTNTSFGGQAAGTGTGTGNGLGMAGGGQATGTGSFVGSANGDNGGAPPASPSPATGTQTDIGVIPDGTIDMVIDGTGVATIRGGVPSAGERQAIATRISQMSGVNRVINLLTIKPALGKINQLDNPPPPPVAAEATAPANAAAPTPIVSAPATSAANTAPARPGEVATDNALTDRATRGLADRAATIGSPVRVKVRDGVAQLTGKVGSVYEAMLAYRTVQQTPGIRSVDDRLEFPVPDGSNGSNPLIEKGRPDDVEPYLEAQLRRQVGETAHIDRVRVQADVLDIRGTLGRAEDRDRFDAILRSMPILRGYQLHTDMPIASP